jgi:hypothetical protein
MARDRLTLEEVDALQQIARQAAAVETGSEKVALRLRAYAAEWHIPAREEQILELAAEAVGLQVDTPDSSSSRSAAALVRRAARDRRARERRNSNRRAKHRRHHALVAFLTDLIRLGQPNRRTGPRRTRKDRRRIERRKQERRRTDRS